MGHRGSHAVAPSPLSGGAAVANDYIEREGVIFEAGVYPDQQFSLTPDELSGASVLWTDQRSSIFSVID